MAAALKTVAEPLIRRLQGDTDCVLVTVHPDFAGDRRR
jgi:hypothetical protein